MLRSPLAPDILKFQEGRKCSSKPKKIKSKQTAESV